MGEAFKVDVHSHMLPKGYIKKLSSRNAPPRILTNPSLLLDCGEGLSFPITERMTSIELRVKELRDAGLDHQVISLPMPGTDPFDRDFACSLASEANDDLAELSRRFEVFSAAATVPLGHPEAAINELQRVVDERGTRLIEIFSNVAGKPLDSPEFVSFFKSASELGVSVLVHPCRPVMMQNVSEYGLAGAVGFIFDTTLAILRLVYSGVFERFPNLRIIIPHLGSTIPYLVGRIDHQYRLLSEGERTLPKPPSEYLKKMYIDTAQSLHKPALECAFDFTPADRILFGTDYPFFDLNSSIEIIKSLHLSREMENMIFSGNAKALRIV